MWELPNFYGWAPVSPAIFPIIRGNTRFFLLKKGSSLSFKGKKCLLSCIEVLKYNYIYG